MIIDRSLFEVDILNISNPSYLFESILQLLGIKFLARLHILSGPPLEVAAEVIVFDFRGLLLYLFEELLLRWELVRREISIDWKQINLC